MRLLLFSFITLLFAGCAAPSGEPDTAASVNISKWQDESLREIHELKNARNTLGLVEYLSDPTPEYRAEAAMALGSVQDSSSAEAILTLIADEYPEVRMMAAFALGQIATPDAARGLIKLINSDTTTVVRTEALEALGKTGSAEAADFLQEYQPNYYFDEAGHSWGIYRLSLRAAANANHERIMTERLQSGYEETRLAAVHFFSRHEAEIPADSLNILTKLAAKDRSPEVRMAAATALGNYNIQNRASVLTSIALEDDHPGVRVNALGALAKIGQGADVAIESLHDSNINAAIAAALLFRDNPALADLGRIRSQALTHPSGTVRGILFETLLQLSEDRKTTIEEILREIKDNPDCAASVVSALGRAPEALHVLDSLAFNAPPKIATPALEALFEVHTTLGSDCNQWQSLFSKIKAKADIGHLALLGSHLRKAGFKGRDCFNTDASWVDLVAQIDLPRGLEARIELSEALRSFSDRFDPAFADQDFLQIDWSTLASYGEQPIAEITTTRGKFSMVLLIDDAPATVSHFINLANAGFFNAKPFHRVVPNFVVQTGCPRGDGYGSGDELLRSEFSPLHYGPGVAGIASAGKDTESTQWFVTHRTTPHLDGRYTIFGAVIEGMDVIWALSPDDTIEQLRIVSFDE